MLRRDRGVHTAQLWDYSFISSPQLMSGDGCSMLHRLCHCLVSIEWSRVLHYSHILHSCILLTLVFRPQRGTENTLLPCQVGVSVCDPSLYSSWYYKALIQPLTSSLGPVCTLDWTALPHVALHAGSWLMGEGKHYCHGHLSVKLDCYKFTQLEQMAVLAIHMSYFISYYWL